MVWYNTNSPLKWSHLTNRDTSWSQIRGNPVVHCAFYCLCTQRQTEGRVPMMHHEVGMFCVYVRAYKRVMSPWSHDVLWVYIAVESSPHFYGGVASLPGHIHCQVSAVHVGDLWWCQVDALFSFQCPTICAQSWALSWRRNRGRDGRQRGRMGDPAWRRSMASTKCCPVL